MSDIQKITEATALLQEMMIQQQALVGGVVKQFTKVEAKVTDLKNDMEYLKNDSEISTSQCKEITRRIKRKIAEHLHHPSLDSVRYSRVYFHYIYKRLRSDYGLGSSTDTTPKRNYASVLAGIQEIEFPDAELREHADILYEANMQLKALMEA